MISICDTWRFPPWQIIVDQEPIFKTSMALTMMCCLVRYVAYMSIVIVHGIITATLVPSDTADDEICLCFVTWASKRKIEKDIWFDDSDTTCILKYDNIKPHTHLATPVLELPPWIDTRYPLQIISISLPQTVDGNVSHWMWILVCDLKLENYSFEIRWQFVPVQSSPQHSIFHSNMFLHCLGEPFEAQVIWIWSFAFFSMWRFSPLWDLQVLITHLWSLTWVFDIGHWSTSKTQVFFIENAKR